jgi:hypothetical protein
MLRLFSPVPDKDHKKYRSPYKRPSQIRHFHTGFGPNVADPCGIIIIVETSHSRDPQTGASGGKVYWTGWRARFITWLIGKLLPSPEVWNVTRAK